MECSVAILGVNSGLLQKFDGQFSMLCCSRNKNHRCNGFEGFRNIRENMYSRGMISRRKKVTWIAKAESKNVNVGKELLPFELQTSAGRFLNGVLCNQSHNFHDAAENQLKKLSADRKDAISCQLLSGHGSHSVLKRRIAELNVKKCQIATEEVVYMLVVQKFLEHGIPMVPRLVACMENGKLNSLLTVEELVSVHSPEIHEMIQDHLSKLLGGRDDDVADNDMILKIDMLTLAKVYVASILYSYFLKRAYQRYQLELNLEMNYIERSKSHYRSKFDFMENVENINLDACTNSWLKSTIRHGQFRDYLLSLGKEAITMFATIRTQECANMIEKHAESLFGMTDVQGKPIIVNDAKTELLVYSFKRLLMEAFAFGSFLWDVEEYVDSIYTMTENSDTVN